MDSQDVKIVSQQKLILRVTQLTAVGFLASGAIIIATGGDVVLGSVLMIVGLCDLIIIPRVFEKIITEKLKQDREKRQ